MMKTVPERDWKALRAIKNELLNIACKRILEKVQSVAGDRDRTAHKAYLEIWRILKDEDYEIALMFDDLKRSNAIHKLAAWRRNGLLTDERLAKFSDETQDTVRFLCGLHR